MGEELFCIENSDFQCLSDNYYDTGREEAYELDVERRHLEELHIIDIVMLL